MELPKIEICIYGIRIVLYGGLVLSDDWNCWSCGSGHEWQLGIAF